MELLLSLQSADELRIAAEYAWSWLDLKNPSAGSLGCPSEETATRFLDVAQEVLSDQSVKLSIALGELGDGALVSDESTAEATNGREEVVTTPFFRSPLNPVILNQFDYVKVALAGTRDGALSRSWFGLAQSLSLQLDQPAKLILVHYADYQLANSVTWAETIQASEALSCEYILVDTFDKTKGSLLDWLSPEDLRGFAIDAQQHGLKLSLAGAVKRDDFSLLESTGASIIGIRGAACQEGSRVSALCRDRLRVLSNYFSSSACSLNGKETIKALG